MSFASRAVSRTIRSWLSLSSGIGLEKSLFADNAGISRPYFVRELRISSLLRWSRSNGHPIGRLLSSSTPSKPYCFAYLHNSSNDKAEPLYHIPPYDMEYKPSSVSYTHLTLPTK